MAKLPKIQISSGVKACFNGEMQPRDVAPGTYEVVADGDAVGENQIPQRIADIAKETGRVKAVKKTGGATDGGAKASASQPTVPASDAKTPEPPKEPDAS